jgi:acyl-CoA reductase-like NAD-dependent aldehyde dehydrogenase
MLIVSIQKKFEIFESAFSFCCKVDYAVNLAHAALFSNAAQMCTAASRTFVHAKIYDQFIARSIELAKKRVVGDPFHPKTEQGPQVKYIILLITIEMIFLYCID